MIDIQQGDCLALMRTIPSGSIDMVLCDLPYGVTARNKWDVIIPFNSLWEQYARVIKEDAAIVLFGSGMFTADLMESNRKMWKYNLIWEKTQPTGFLNAQRMPLRCHEDILVFYKKQPTYNPQKTSGHVRKVSKAVHCKTAKKSLSYGDYSFTDYESDERFPRSVITFPKDTQKSALHPTQKPVSLLEYLIRTYTNKGDTVLDNCMGSGSTGVACIHTERNFIGYELDEDIFKTACERIASELKKERY
nr:MAG TPA: adenine-specific methyltransferase [Caudoviricetes sp.]